MGPEAWVLTSLPGASATCSSLGTADQILAPKETGLLPEGTVPSSPLQGGCGSLPAPKDISPWRWLGVLCFEMICAPPPFNVPSRSEGLFNRRLPGVAAGWPAHFHPFFHHQAGDVSLDAEDLTVTLAPLSSQTCLAPVIIFLVPLRPPSYIVTTQGLTSMSLPPRALFGVPSLHPSPVPCHLVLSRRST